MLNYEGVDDQIATVISETADIQDPASILHDELEGKMGEGFDLEALRKAWRKTKGKVPAEVVD